MKHLNYLHYLLRHKWFVILASLRIGASLWLAIIHDASKFKPSEWMPYVDYFYGKRHAAEVAEAFRIYGLAELPPYGFYAKDRFNIAWLHHQKRNKHHWQYWLLTKDSGETFPLPMPRRYVLEMVADWMGAGRVITGKWEVRAWYEKNKEKIQLHPETKILVEEILAHRCRHL